MIRGIGLAGIFALLSFACGEGVTSDEGTGRTQSAQAPAKETSAAPAPTGPSDGTRATQAGTRLVSIELKSASILPFKKATKTSWDDFSLVQSKVADSLVDGVANALALPDPYTLVAKLALDAAAQGYKRPDAEGKATLYYRGQPLDTKTIVETGDEYNPQTHARWQHVTLDEHVRIELSLVDVDSVDSNDSIGTVQLNDDDLRAALAAKNVLQVQTDGQDTQQILFVGVSVMEE